MILNMQNGNLVFFFNQIYQLHQDIEYHRRGETSISGYYYTLQAKCGKDWSSIITLHTFARKLMNKELGMRVERYLNSLL